MQLGLLIMRTIAHAAPPPVHLDKIVQLFCKNYTIGPSSIGGDWLISEKLRTLIKVLLAFIFAVSRYKICLNDNNNWENDEG